MNSTSSWWLKKKKRLDLTDGGREEVVQKQTTAPQKKKNTWKTMAQISFYYLSGFILLWVAAAWRQKMCVKLAQRTAQGWEPNSSWPERSSESEAHISETLRQCDLNDKLLKFGFMDLGKNRVTLQPTLVDHVDHVYSRRCFQKSKLFFIS